MVTFAVTMVGYVVVAIRYVEYGACMRVVVCCVVANALRGVVVSGGVAVSICVVVVIIIIAVCGVYVVVVVSCHVFVCWCYRYCCC